MDDNVVDQAAAPTQSGAPAGKPRELLVIDESSHVATIYQMVAMKAIDQPAGLDAIYQLVEARAVQSRSGTPKCKCADCERRDRLVSYSRIGSAIVTTVVAIYSLIRGHLGL